MSRIDRVAVACAVVAASVAAACGGPQRGGARCGRAAVIGDEAELTEVAMCSSVGDLVIRTGAHIDLTRWTELDHVTGAISIGPTSAIEQLVIPNLRAIDGAVRISANLSLREIALPALERATAITIEANPELATVALPTLRQIGLLHVIDDPDLALLDLGSLARVEGELRLDTVPSLSSLEAPKLERIGDLHVVRATKLPDDIAQRLRAAAAHDGP